MQRNRHLHPPKRPFCQIPFCTFTIRKRKTTITTSGNPSNRILLRNLPTRPSSFPPLQRHLTHPERPRQRLATFLCFHPHPPLHPGCPLPPDRPPKIPNLGQTENVHDSPTRRTIEQAATPIHADTSFPKKYKRSSITIFHQMIYSHYNRILFALQTTHEQR